MIGNPYGGGKPLFTKNNQSFQQISKNRLVWVPLDQIMGYLVGGVGYRPNEEGDPLFNYFYFQ
jgi:hypothetical protein